MTPNTKYPSKARLRTRALFAGPRGAPPRWTANANQRRRESSSNETARRPNGPAGCFAGPAPVVYGVAIPNGYRHPRGVPD
jgi:hypothetical protein